MGGETIDDLIYKHVLEKSGISKTVRLNKSALLESCRRAKESLTYEASASIKIPGGGAVELTRAQFEEILLQNKLFKKLEQLMDRTLLAAHEDFGVKEDSYASVIVVGGSALIPSFQQKLRERFSEHVLNFSSVDLLSQGAACFAAGADLFDHLKFDYALYVFDPGTSSFIFDPIIKKGQRYPTKGPVAKRSVAATMYNQTKFDLVIGMKSTKSNSALDTGKSVRRDDTYSFINKEAPYILQITNPVQKGQKCIEIEFGLDASKQLTVTTHSLDRFGVKTTALLNCPIAKLT